MVLHASAAAGCATDEAHTTLGVPQWEAGVRRDSGEQRSGAVSTWRHTDVGPVDGDGAVVAAVAAAVSRRTVAESAGEPLLDSW